MQETVWTLPCFGTRTVLWYPFIPFWIDHNSHDLYVSSTWPLHVFANPTGKATAYVHGRVCSQDWAALRVKSMSHCSNPLCPRSLDWAMLAQPWCSPWPSWRPAKRTRAWRRAARSRWPRGRRSPLRWEIAWYASPRETWWTCSPCRGGCGWWQFKDPKDLVVAGFVGSHWSTKRVAIAAHVWSPSKPKTKIKSTKIHPDIFAQEKGQECQWYLVLVNNRNYANDKGYTMWIEHDRTQNICHPATSKKLPPGLLDFYGAFSFSPSSLLLNWFGSFFLAFCSSIWLTTGYYGRLAFSKMAWFMGSQREHHPPTVLPCLRLLKGIISKKWFHLQLKWDPTKDQQPRVYESWVEIMWSSFFVNFQPSFRFIQKTCSPFQRREGVPFHLIFSGGFASCSCAENGGFHPLVNAIYFDTESEVSKLRDLDGFGGYRAPGYPLKETNPIVASTSPES